MENSVARERLSVSGLESGLEGLRQDVAGLLMVSRAGREGGEKVLVESACWMIVGSIRGLGVVVKTVADCSVSLNSHQCLDSDVSQVVTMTAASSSSKTPSRTIFPVPTLSQPLSMASLPSPWASL